MASQNYLIAIALIEQNNERAMPLGGKEIKGDIENKEIFKKQSEEVILNLLLRLIQRSDEGPIKRLSAALIFSIVSFPSLHIFI